MAARGGSWTDAQTFFTASQTGLESKLQSGFDSYKAYAVEGRFSEERHSEQVEGRHSERSEESLSQP
jgi:hypothetical protein